ncbi:MAG TPA: SMP-30/gluconolactonase/LRE family protein [Polyangia bacterium]|jgi:gluconolactonase
MTSDPTRRLTIVMTVLSVGLCAGACSNGASGSGGSGGAAGSIGSGGATTGSAPGSGGSATGGAPGSGGAPAPDAASDANIDATGDRPSDAIGPALPGGASGRTICPAGVGYSGMTPAMTGAITMGQGEILANAEGPVWMASQGAFLFTAKMPGRDDIRRIGKFTMPGAVQTFIKVSSGNTNLGNLGMTLDNDDQLLTADTQLSAVTRVDPVTGDTVETIAAQYMGRAFESPNDLIVRGDGNIYFSDPDNANVLGPKPKTGNTAVYRIAPNQEISVLEIIGPETAQHTNDPNGVALSPDDNTLYFIITHRTQVKKFALGADGAPVGASTVFASKTGMTPDGMCVDCAGDVYVSTQAGVEVYDPAGNKLTTIGPAGAINCSFGGSDHQVLFVTAAPHVWWVNMNIPGLP